MIHVLYRHTNNSSGIGKNRPKWFSYENCLHSMLNSIKENDFVKFHLLYDGECKIENPRIDVIKSFKGGSDWNSYVYAWNYAMSLDLNDNDIIFFAENDYMFMHDWATKIKELFDTYDDLNYVSLYDHPHFYNRIDYPELYSYIITTASHHWKTVPSSTGSIIISKRILYEDFEVHTSNPSDRGRFEYLNSTKGRYVLAPIPSLSTHCEIEWLAPIIDWEIISKQK